MIIVLPLASSLSSQLWRRVPRILREPYPESTTEIATGWFRPRQLVVRDASGRTELTFRSWVLNSAGPELFTGMALESRNLTVPVKGTGP